MHIYYRVCEKEPTISFVGRYAELSKKTILRKSWLSLAPQITDRDEVTIIHDEVSKKTLDWMEGKLASGLVNYVEVPSHDFSYHAHTVTLLETLKNNLQDDKKIHFLIEDDYLFAPKALETIKSLEGLYGAFFVPYDYPDRYKNNETCQVILGPTCHWRTINSCTMTIGASALVWKQFLNQLTLAAPTSNDKVFEEIFKIIPCISPLPGIATHLTDSHPTPYFPINKILTQLDIT